MHWMQPKTDKRNMAFKINKTANVFEYVDVLYFQKIPWYYVLYTDRHKIQAALHQRFGTEGTDNL